jgi:hypothetical protein
MHEWLFFPYIWVLLRKLKIVRVRGRSETANFRKRLILIVDVVSGETGILEISLALLALCESLSSSILEFP